MRKSWQVGGTARRLVVCPRGCEGVGEKQKGSREGLADFLGERSPGKDFGFYSKLRRSHWKVLRREVTYMI